MKSDDDKKASYLDEVMVQNRMVEEELRPRQRLAAPTGEPWPARGAELAASGPVSGAPILSRAPVRITGLWRLRTVIVPPDMYVVHTRRGQKEPLHLGLGISFRFDPARDSFLVVPSAMQTIIINARGICQELQGLLVQAYVQWIIDDFATAYPRLDFSDPGDPMRIVNVQLREQAEAAIKDKIATMSIRDILSDKQPIIEELTLRLRGVAEGTDDKKSGLGLRIVTVQIKEAVVSSERLWQNMQRPFRDQQERVARLSTLSLEEDLRSRELDNARRLSIREAETKAEIARTTAQQESSAFEVTAAEKARRFRFEQEHEKAEVEGRSETELVRGAAQLKTELADRARDVERSGAEEVARTAALKSRREVQKLEIVLSAEALKHRAHELSEEARLLELRRRAEGYHSHESLQAKMIEVIPEIARQLPKPQELRSVVIGNSGPTAQLAELAAGVLSVANALGLKLNRSQDSGAKA